MQQVEYVCPRCDGALVCLPGEPAYSDNWYCEDNLGCGWHAWLSPFGPIPKQVIKTVKKESPPDA